MRKNGQNKSMAIGHLFLADGVIRHLPNGLDENTPVLR